ncbi:TetR/AcrR family transcriptional regulator [Corynebacterium variabile]|uniref:TetR/AcrR family transcriptional regulator n=1 Tax=Corynebacterium variabile TaxID=1727 RepID=UPI003F9DD007
MPKINADTLEEHRSKVMKDLLDGTERILLSHGSRRLTTAAVAAEAGIARNSIYRYVHSVDDLVEMVLTRGFEEWTAQVRAAADAAPDARSAVIAYVHSNLTQAFSGQHELQQALPASELTPSARARIGMMHRGIAAVLRDSVAALDTSNPDLVASAVGALVDRAVTSSDTVDSPEDAARITVFTCAAAAAVVDADLTGATSVTDSPTPVSTAPDAPVDPT